MKLQARNLFFALVWACAASFVFLVGFYSPYKQYASIRDRAKSLESQVTSLTHQIATKDTQLQKTNEELAVLKSTPPPPLLAEKVGGEMADAIKRLNHTIAKMKPEKVSLKTRAKYLSDEILQFTDERRSHEPEFNIEAKSDEQIQAAMNQRSKYDQITKSLFSRRFASRIIEIRNELAAAGAVDEELDRHYEYSTNYIVMRIIAVRIGVLAERLP